MNLKKSLIVFILLLGILNLTGAKPKMETNYRSPIFIGEIIEVYKEDEKVIEITVEGYLKTNDIYKEKLVGIISEDTKIINSENNKIEDIELEKGDLVYMRVSEIFTKSIPPKTVVKRMFVTKLK